MHYHREYHFPVISFDLRESEHKAKIVNLLKTLDIDLNPEGFEFYDDSLRQYNDSSDSYIQEDIMCLYKQLQESAL